MELLCVRCGRKKHEEEFTKFSRNPALRDRKYRTVTCRDCCNEFMENGNNTKDTLKELLRMQDIPYIEKVADDAIKTFQKKRKNTNIVIRKNVYDENEETVGKETSKIQTSVYACYCARVGTMPRSYVNFTFSDGIREMLKDKEEKKEELNKQKEIDTARNFLLKQYGEDIFKDKVRLIKAVQLSVEEVALHKNNVNKRQFKFKLKNCINTLVEAEILQKKDFAFIVSYDDVEDEENNDSSKEQEEEKIYSSFWKGMYTQMEIDYLNEYYEGLNRDFKIITINHQDYAKKIAKASLHMDKCFDEMLNGVTNADKKYKEARDSFDILSKSAQFSENSRGQNDVSLGCFGKVFEKVEQKKWIPQHTPMIKDDIDKLIEYFSTINKSL